MRTPPPPLFSIVLPTHNRAELLGRALASVVAQQEPRWELLIVDDGSTDSTWPLLCDWRVREPRLRCWWQSNRGQSASRPAATACCRPRKRRGSCFSTATTSSSRSIWRAAAR